MFRSSIVVSLLLNSVAINAFLFPDLKVRTGRGGNSAALRIAVMQEEPYLFANGSGYVPDLMRRISDYHSGLHDGNSFSYEIIPVRSWPELLSRATRPTGGVSFGLVVPSLELSDWHSKHLRTSVPTVYTSVKLVSKKGGFSNDESRFQLRNGRQGQVVVLKGSPLEYVLVRANNYLGTVQTVDSMEEALTKLRSNEGAVLLTSAGVADSLSAAVSDDLISQCTKKIPGTSPLFYAFFGRDSKLLDQLNEVIVQLMSGDSLLSLYAKYFTGTRQCLL